MIFAKDAPFSKQVQLLMQPGCQVHFGQFGEDVLFPFLFANKRYGFYVDVGCFDPFNFSNTFILHSQFDWTGINIDASPQTIDRFRTHRPNDVNLNVGVSTERKELEFYMFKAGAVNTFDKEAALRQSKQFGNFSTALVQVKPLKDILAEHMNGTHIDYMNIDCEWLDHDVVLSNDWEKYRPRFLTVELHGFALNACHENEIVKFLSSVGYKLHSFFFVTGLFERTN